MGWIKLHALLYGISHGGIPFKSVRNAKSDTDKITLRKRNKKIKKNKKTGEKRLTKNKSEAIIDYAVWERAAYIEA